MDLFPSRNINLYLPHWIEILFPILTFYVNMLQIFFLLCFCFESCLWCSFLTYRNLILMLSQWFVFIKTPVFDFTIIKPTPSVASNSSWCFCVHVPNEILYVPKIRQNDKAGWMPKAKRHTREARILHSLQREGSGQLTPEREDNGGQEVCHPQSGDGPPGNVRKLIEVRALHTRGLSALMGVGWEMGQRSRCMAEIPVLEM